MHLKKLVIAIIMVITTFTAFNTYADIGGPSSLNALSRLKPMMKDKTSWVCEKKIVEVIIDKNGNTSSGEFKSTGELYTLEWNIKKYSSYKLTSPNEERKISGLKPDGPGMWNVKTEDFGTILKIFPDKSISVFYLDMAKTKPEFFSCN